jgi:dTDP-glucose pyrophosphorylase
MKPTLVILAAGMGSRYGGLKQVEPVGPCGETILDYSVFDALRAGFGKVVFVVRPEMQGEFRSQIGQRIERHVAAAYAPQSVGMLPAGFRVPIGRSKPWGTGHAVLSAENAVDTPFVAANADDFYGPAAFADAAGFLLDERQAAAFTYAMIGYQLCDTLPKSGRVSRAICRCTSEGRLERIEEVTGIERQGLDAQYTDCAGQVRFISGGELVSMNLWAFAPSVFDLLGQAFHRFLEQHAASPDAEFHLPSAVGTMIQSGAAKVRVLRSRDPWCGVTHREDRVAVAERVREMIDRGVYPRELWG